MDDDRYSQFRCPKGEIGNSVLVEMNEHHRPLTEWALSNLPDMEPMTILDIGCGGGMMISLLGERYCDSAIVGIDISEDSVEYARHVNSDLIAEGRCDIRRCSVDDMPFADGIVDLAVSCESYFFWPDLIDAAEEISRVVKDGGYAVIISESYPHPDFDERNGENSRLTGMRLVSNDYMEALLGTFGFSVTALTYPENNWIMFIAKKDLSSAVFFS